MIIELHPFQTDNTIREQLDVIDGEVCEALTADDDDNLGGELWDIIQSSFTGLNILYKGDPQAITRSKMLHDEKMLSRGYCRRNGEINVSMS